MRFFLFAFLFIIHGFLSAQTLPEQPRSGPGGQNYLHDEIRITNRADEKSGFWFFEPASPTPDTAHVVVFLHGYGAINPMIYGGWIKHLVRKGNIIVYPRYQKGIFPPKTRHFADQAVVGIHNALDTLNNGDHIVPITSHFSIVGHSYGGTLAANLTAKFQEYQLPKPVAVLLCSPGTGPFKGGILDSYDNIPSDTKLLVMVSEKDKTVGDKLGKKIFLTAVNTIDKHLITQLEDRRFRKNNIRAGHNESYSLDPTLNLFKKTIVTKRAAKANRIDPVDYFGYWKLLDALHTCTRKDYDCNFAIGNTYEQAFMGFWSDGMPVKPLNIK